ncbi:AN1-type zinc finger protein 2A-like isoform X2 [Saccoglossus kowalevskii]|uniref:AN1-type zinc finger protein 2B-like isoform X2 n=1 Tax=Saccoglossus kowalevskii TaxID=10224 RepID=A0ABM0M729_SACKO|nr:PREDICTED: AN1-type zinc finger protein 2B-like isoform X2 [Saccoglossus kowalevskii]
MEFPDLGQQCSDQTCKQLDFLPMKCDSCSRIFCKDHITYSSHNCESSYKKDVQVPVCPLCNKPVPVNRGEPPDIKVSEHIDRDCQSDPAKKKRKAYANRCNVKGCKQKELIPVICGSCQLNFCLKHRHTTDHKCEGFQGSGRGISKAGAAATRRVGASGSSSGSNPPSNTYNKAKSKPQVTALSNYGRDLDRERREREQQRQVQPQPQSAYSLQAGLSEDEAMARALQMSMADSQQPKQAAPKKTLTRQEQDDLALAQALAASEAEHRREQLRRRQQQEEKKESSCLVA